jgi:hypothetical protein
MLRIARLHLSRPSSSSFRPEYAKVRVCAAGDGSDCSHQLITPVFVLSVLSLVAVTSDCSHTLLVPVRARIIITSGCH